MSRINTNVSSLIAQTTLGRSNGQLQTALSRLSTGLRINTGKDDPAGLIASENLRRDITAANKAISNTERANQLIATADSALGQVSDLLNDVRGLVTEAANTGVLSSEQIAANQLQVDSSLEAIDRIAQVTTFQGRKLLDGSLDFTTNVLSGASSVSDLQVDKANFGTADSLSVAVDVTAAASQALITNSSINFTSGVKSSGTITFTDTAAVQGQGNLTLTNSPGTINVAAVAGGAADGALGSATNITIQDSASIAQAAGDLALTNSGAGGVIHITAVAGGAADGATGNAINVVLQAGGATTASYAAGTITVDVAAGDTIDDIRTAINGLADFNATTTSGGTEVYNALDTGGANVLSGGNSGVGGATYNSGTNVITVNRAVGDTVSDIAGYINGLADFNASATAGGANTYLASDNQTFTAPLLNGANAISDVLTIQSASTGTAFNGTLTFNTSNSVAANDVLVQKSGSNITVTVNNASTYDTTTLASQIQSQLAGYTVTQSGTAGDNSFAAATDSATTTALTGGTNDTGTGLGADLVLKLSGSKGAEVFTFNAGSTLAQVVSAINLISDATGVQAVNNAGALELRSTEYGSEAIVDADVVSEGAGGTFAASLSAKHAAGADIQGTINGYQGNGKGNTLSLNTSTLGLSLTVANGSSTDVNFDITGGGAVFQIGPNVVSNQQARIGISSVNSAKLGGTSGRLYELRSGNAKDLSNDPTSAAQVVDQAISKVTSLRGRLGAFQRTTLESNINSLKDTVTNLTQAQSSIRDADFAAESAALTRAQILVQSGTTVLQIANQNPQQVLALLRG